MRTAAASVLLALSFPVLAIPPVPRPSKEFTFVEPSGKQTLLSSRKGKVVYIQFLSTTCPHCQALSRDLSRLQTGLGPQGFEVWGVAFDGSPAAQVENYKRQYATTFPVASAPRDTVLGYLGLSVMERFYVPQVVVIDKTGVIRAQSVPETSPELMEDAPLRKFLAPLLAEPRRQSSAKAPRAK
jgi:peroxiredoxin